MARLFTHVAIFPPLKMIADFASPGPTASFENGVILGW